MRNHRLHRRSLAPLALGLSVWLLWPTQALARALVRFIHAVPGAGTATVDINGEAVGTIGFAQSSQWHSIRSGSFAWKLTGAGKTLAQGTASVGSGAYDIVVLEKSSQVVLAVYKAAAGRPGTSLLRVIHGAPELGSPELTIDGKQAVASLSYTHATPYVSINPGAHSLGAMRHGDSTPLVTDGAHVNLIADRSYSSIVLGTRGQRVRVVTLVDRGAPLTRQASHSAASSSTSGSGADDDEYPMSKLPGAPKPGSTVVVRSGDSLWAIARRMVGPTGSDEDVQKCLVEMWDANESRIGTGDPNLIFPGMRLRMPE